MVAFEGSSDYGYNWTPFHTAIACGQSKIFEMLFRKFEFFYNREIEVAAETVFNLSPLKMAILNGNKEILELLGGSKRSPIEVREDLFVNSDYEKTFPDYKEMCYAIRHRESKSLKDLLSKERDFALFERRKPYRPGEWLLNDYEEHPNMLDFASSMFNLDFFDYLIEKEVDIDELEFDLWRRRRNIFFNWCLMLIHPKGGGFFKRLKGSLSESGADGQNKAWTKFSLGD